MKRHARAMFALTTLIAACAVPGIAQAAPGQGFLPDNRAWELVSPPDKNGGDVMAQPGRTRASSDGEAVGYLSLSAFGDAAGMGVAAEYMSRRDGSVGTSGWTTHSTLPELDPISLDAAANAMDSLYVGEFSDDFSAGVLRTLTNIDGDPNIAGVTNLYLRTGLDFPGAGAYQLLTACPACTSPLTFYANPEFIDATPDMGHVIFESRYKLTPDAPAPTSDCIEFNFECQPQLYEWDHGTLRAAAVLPAAEGGTVAPRSVAASGQSGPRYTLRAISDDGSRIFFMVPSSAEETDGRLYMREDHTTTVRINTSERTVPDSTRPAFFQTASTDGSKVLFTTRQKLTDDDNNNSVDLYLYDASLPDADPHNLTLVSVDHEASDELGHQVDGMLGASDDGSYVYFTARGQLVAGGPPVSAGFGIYAWHNGSLTYVGQFSVSDDLGANLMGGSFGIAPLASRVTPDGRHLAFTATDGSGLTGYDHSIGNSNCGVISSQGSCSELYVYGADAGELACASCNPSGAPASADASFNLVSGTGGSLAASHLNHPFSADGSRLFFTTGERLVAEDRNGAKRDVYSYDTATGDLRLISSGRSPDDSYFLDAGSNGRDVFFVTRERLVGWDTDDGYDLYDAREGGGFPEPPATPAACAGGACQGSPPANPPGQLGLASAGFYGPGNVALKPKKKHRHKKRQHRRGSHNRGGNR